MEKLDCILLIDDDRATNFIHERLLRSIDCTNRIIAFTDAKEALEFLKTKNSENNYPKPELVFLDINMPGMNGWEFLDEYDNLNEDQKAGLVIVMVTTSLNPDDHEKARKRKIGEFLNKPLTKEAVTKLINKEMLRLSK